LSASRAFLWGTSLIRASVDLAEQVDWLRVRAADLAEVMADEAEHFAAYLVINSARGDRERRLKIATTEREIAKIGRRNAARWRDPHRRPGRAEPLPHLIDRP
jgi:hypothetical protein